jgi:hypothetical protein
VDLSADDRQSGLPWDLWQEIQRAYSKAVAMRSSGRAPAAPRARLLASIRSCEGSGGRGHALVVGVLAPALAQGREAFVDPLLRQRRSAGQELRGQSVMAEDVLVLEPPQKD